MSIPVALSLFAMLLPVPAVAVQPTSYSLLDEGYLTEVRTSTNFAYSFVYAVTASVESNMLLKQKSAQDYSELHLLYYTYNKQASDPLGGRTGDTLDSNGRAAPLHEGLAGDSVYALACRKDLVNESTMPESLASETIAGTLLFFCGPYANSTAYLQNTCQVSIGNTNAIKALIQTMWAGAVRFSVEPDEYGAFFGSNGYCWLSYEDAAISENVHFLVWIYPSNMTITTVHAGWSRECPFCNIGETDRFYQDVE